MMYGFGDVKNPRDDTVAVLEEIAVEYMTQMVSSMLVLSIRIDLTHSLTLSEDAKSDQSQWPSWQG